MSKKEKEEIQKFKEEKQGDHNENEKKEGNG